LFKIERFHIFAASFARALATDPKKVVEALAKTSLSGGTGRRARLKIVCLRACRFDSGLRYISLTGNKKAFSNEGFFAFTGNSVI
jgi:hypothetical protein